MQVFLGILSQEEPCGLSHRKQADRKHTLTGSAHACTHVFMCPGKPHISTFTCTGTDSQPADTELWPFAATSYTKVGGGGFQIKTNKKNTPMTLKSFYSRNHRLPSPWIRAVTLAPACLPPRLPKLPAGRQTGRLPSYCQRGQGRGRTRWERFDATHNHTQGLNQGGRNSERQTGKQ